MVLLNTTKKLCRGNRCLEVRGTVVFYTSSLTVAQALGISQWIFQQDLNVTLDVNLRD
jgi:hypothetical protein